MVQRNQMLWGGGVPEWSLRLGGLILPAAESGKEKQPAPYADCEL